jgi:hypothetical protein
MKLRGLYRTLQVLVASVVVVVAAAWASTLPQFDERLHPDLQALKKARSPSLEQNAYLTGLGFLATDEKDADAAGKAIVALLTARYEAGEKIALTPEQRRSIVGTPGPEAWQSGLKTLECVPRVDLDCADRLIADAATLDLAQPRLAVLTRRFEQLVHQQRFDEGEQRDFATPYAAYLGIRSISRILLATSFSRDSDATFIVRALDHQRFWKMVLREGTTLVDKMVAVAGIQDTLDFLSALMRERTLSTENARLIHDAVTPLTAEELDISEGFIAEVRMHLLSRGFPLAESASPYQRLLLRRNATLNDYYSSIIQPMVRRAKLSPAEFHHSGGNQPLDLSVGHRPPLLFNRDGYQLVHNLAWDPEQYVARTQDQNGRLMLVALQAELEHTAVAEREAVIRASAHRNPYTGEPMRYDDHAGTISFPCLHTAYHPPALPDQCAVRVDQAPAQMVMLPSAADGVAGPALTMTPNIDD